MSERASTGRHRILVVDDDPATANLARIEFANQPFDILEAADGTEGLRAALTDDPDLILLDLRMPDVDGISVARQLKDDPRTRAIPVVLLTASRDVNDKVKAFAAGADDYITKPIVFEEVAARIQALLRRRELLVKLESTVADLTSTNQRLEQLVVIDEKTGLYNFREFQRRLNEEWQRADRYVVPLSLVFFDIDYFKRVNDTLGHQAGDRVLQEFATLVAGGARANDVAARYGGEEFAVILPHTGGSLAMRVAERVRRAVEAFVFLKDDTPTRITVSGGVATAPSAAQIRCVDDLVRTADGALYRAQDLGRNRIVEAAEPLES